MTNFRDNNIKDSNSANSEFLNQIGRDMLRRIGLEQFGPHLNEISKSIKRGHRLLETDEKVRLLGMEIEDYRPSEADIQAATRAASESAKREFATARRQAAQTRRYLREAMSSQGWKEASSKFRELQGTDELRRALREGKQQWREEILQMPASPQESRELLAIWEQAEEKLNRDGFEVLFQEVDENLKAHERILQERENWGKNPHSPLEWWKWVIIAAIVGVAIATVVVCLIWFGCSWIYAIFVGICGASLCGGFIFW